jgi:hypothetical protein
MPTIAELAGVQAPSDIDGMSIVPELLGESVAGRKQAQHEYLYWELGSQVAVRLQDWKAVKTRKDNWELYDLSQDISETNDLSGTNAEMLQRLKGIAAAASTPVKEGTFSDPEIHERDRRAKFGGQPKRSSQSRVLPKRGLISNQDWKIAHVSSESVGQRQAAHAIDGDPKTHWHTSFAGKIEQHPHELVIDLGASYTIRGFRYLARQDGGWNGAVKDCEFFVSDSAAEFEGPAIQAVFEKSKEPQEASCPPTVGRYIRMRVLSEVNGGPWASISELGVVGDPLKK